jgi:hypothetical protein
MLQQEERLFTMIQEVHLLPAFFNAVATAMELIADREQKFQPQSSLFSAVLSYQQADEERYNTHYFPIFKKAQEHIAACTTRTDSINLGMSFAKEMRLLLEKELKERFAYERFVPFTLTKKEDIFVPTIRWIELFLHRSSELDSEDQPTADELDFLKNVLYAYSEVDISAKAPSSFEQELNTFLLNAKEQLQAYGTRKKSIRQFVVKSLVDFLPKSSLQNDETQFISSLFSIYKVAKDELVKHARRTKTTIIEPVKNVTAGDLVVAVATVKKIAEKQLVQIDETKIVKEIYLALTLLLERLRERPSVWEEEVKTLGSFRIRRSARASSLSTLELKRSATARSIATYAASPLVKSSSSNPELPVLTVDETSTQKLSVSDASGRSHTWPKDLSKESPRGGAKGFPMTFPTGLLQSTDLSGELGITSPRLSPKETATMLIEELLETIAPFIGVAT